MAMVGKIELIKKWHPFIEEVEYEVNKDSACRMSMTMLSIIAVDAAAEACDEGEFLRNVLSVVDGSKNIETDESIDPVKRREMAIEIFDHIDEQSEVFDSKCKCMKK